MKPHEMSKMSAGKRDRMKWNDEIPVYERDLHNA